MSPPPVTICILTFGDYPSLARACVGSILRYCERSLYRLVVGANAACNETLAYLEGLRDEGVIDYLVLSPININKCPMMRRMFANIDTELVWWFDDDSFITHPSALSDRIRIARDSPPSTMIWGHQFFFGHELDFSSGTDVANFVKSAPWYRQKEPPSWEPGGKGETNFEGRGVGDGRWFFITGGCWLIRTAAIRALDWPDHRLVKRADDVFLCEALRQQGWDMKDIGPLGVDINTEPRRGVEEDPVTMVQQIGSAPREPDLSGWFCPEEATIYKRLASRVHGGTVVEIGVWKGRSISNILDICRANRNRLVAIDSWHPADDDPDFIEARSRDIRQVFIDNLRILAHLDTVDILQEDSAQAAARFADGSVDLLFLDGYDSYEAVKRDLCAWRPKIRPGGTLAGHDYIWKEGVRRAVHDVFGDHIALLGGSIWQAQDPQWSLGRGCIFIPTFCNSDLLDQNFGNRRDLTANVDIWVYDDNVNVEECQKVRALCQANGWEYRRSGRQRHGSWRSEYSNLTGFNRFMWESMTFLGEHYDYVVKMDPDAYVIESDWYREFSGMLSERTAIAGTPETRPTRDVMSFWTLARKAGFDFDIGDYVTHLQGGIFGVSRAALEKVASMGFLAGNHVGFGEDCYMSYSARILGIEFFTTQTTGSWWRPYRPKLELIRHLKAIHPLTRLGWEVFVRQPPSICARLD